MNFFRWGLLRDDFHLSRFGTQPYDIKALLEAPAPPYLGAVSPKPPYEEIFDNPGPTHPALIAELQVCVP